MIRLNVFLIVLLAIFYWPTYILDFAGRDVAQKLYFVMLPLFFCGLALILYKKIRVPDISAAYLLFFVLLFFVFIQNIELADARRVYLPIKQLLLFLFFCSVYTLLLAYFNGSNYKKIHKSIYIVYGIQFLVVFIQLIKPETTVFSLFNARLATSPMGVRAPGTFEWVYITCFVFNFFIYFTLVDAFVFGKKKGYFLAGLALIVVLLSQSKTGYIASFLSIIYLTFLLVIFNVKGKAKAIKSLILGMFLVVLLFSFADIELTHIENFINYAFGDGKMDGSTTTRIRQSNAALQVGIEYWHTGYLGAYDFVIENGYLDYLYRYGFFGIFYYLTFSGLIYFISFQNCKVIIRAYKLGLLENRVVLNLAIASHGTLLLAFFYSFSSAPFDGYKSAFWCCLMLAISTALRNAKRLRFRTSNLKKDSCDTL